MREKSELHVIEICLNVGFENTGYFGRKFKEIIGKTPIEYLKNSGTNGRAPIPKINPKIH